MSSYLWQPGRDPVSSARDGSEINVHNWKRKSHRVGGGAAEELEREI